LGRIGDGTVEGEAKAVGEFLGGVGDIIPELIGIEAQPQALDGIEVRRIGRQIHRFKMVLVNLSGLVPRGVVHDEQLPLIFFSGITFASSSR
jgi:hypothetical protein